MSVRDFLPISPTGLGACCLQPEPWVTQGSPLWRGGLVFYKVNGISLSQALPGPAKRQDKRVWVPGSSPCCPAPGFHEGAVAPLPSPGGLLSLVRCRRTPGSTVGQFTPFFLTPKAALLLPTGRSTKQLPHDFESKRPMTVRCAITLCTNKKKCLVLIKP